MKSRKTRAIIDTPMSCLCQRCFDQIQWRIDYHKYKPLTLFARCNDCGQKSINKAYRQLCDPCAKVKTATPVNKETGEPINLNLEVTQGGEIDPSQYELKELKKCSKCAQPTKVYATKPLSQKEQEAKDEQHEALMLEVLDTLRVRQQRQIKRLMNKGEVEFNGKVFFYVEGGKEFDLDGQDDDEDDEEECKSGADSDN